MARHALIISNANYPGGEIVHAITQGDRIAAVLAQADFDVVRVSDGTTDTMLEGIATFLERLSQSPSVALVYYLGHAAQQDGANYLISLDAPIDSEADIEFNAIGILDLLTEIGYTQSQVNLMILDVPTQAEIIPTLPLSRLGLAELSSSVMPPNTLMAYASAPSTPIDQPEVFGLLLARYMMTSELSFDEVLSAVRSDVAQRTANRQVPWKISNLAVDFYLFQPNSILIENAITSHEPNVDEPAAVEVSDPTPMAPSDVELVYWQTAAGDNDGDLLALYLEQYPKGFFVEQARARLAELQPERGVLADADVGPKIATRGLSTSTPQAAGAVEQAFWETIDKTQSVELELYLSKFPNGFYAAQAHAAIEDLTAPARGLAGAQPGLDIATWKAIENSDDPAIFREFVDNFPSSEFTELALLRIESYSVSVKSPPSQKALALLERAREAFAAKRLTTPVEDNAVRWVEAVLAEHPNNPEAMGILQQVIDQYLAWGRSNVQRGRIKHARSYLERAMSLEQYANEAHRQAFASLGRDINALPRATRSVQQTRSTSSSKAEEPGFWGTLKQGLGQLPFGDSVTPDNPRDRR